MNKAFNGIKAPKLKQAVAIIYDENINIRNYENGVNWLTYDNESDD